MATMAGGEAEAEFFGSCAGGDSDDRHQVDLMLDSLLPANADLPRYAQRFRRHTQALVRRHRATIERVAGQLLKRTTLKAEEIDAIIAGE